MNPWCTEWESLGDGLDVLCTDDGYRVSQPGDADDREVAALLAKKFGGDPRDWARRTEWSSAAGEPDVTALWGRS